MQRMIDKTSTYNFFHAKNYLFLIFSVSVTFLSCNPENAEPPSLVRIELLSSNEGKLDVINNETTSLTLQGFDLGNQPFEITSTVVWSINNNNVAVDQNGTVTALSVGTSTITAAVGEISTTIEITTWDSSAPRIEIYVSDVGNNRNGPHQIVKYDEDGSNPEVYINSGLSRPQDIVFLENRGIVLVSNFSGNNINKYDIETGDLIGSFVSGLGGPTRIDIGPDSLLYVLQWNSGGVNRYTLDGTFVDNFTTPIFHAIGMDWDGQGNLYVSSFNNGSNGFVKKFDLAGQDQGFFINSNLTGPTDIWFDRSGNLLVNDWSGSTVQKFGRDGSYEGTFISGIAQPEGVAVLSDRSILIGASGTGSVRKYNSDGSFNKDLVPTGIGLITPNAVVLRKVKLPLSIAPILVDIG